MPRLGDKIFKDANIEALLKVLESADREVREEVFKAIGRKLTRAGKARSIAKIRKIVETTDPKIKQWIAEAIPKSYNNGLSFADFEVSSIRLNSKVAKSVVKDTVFQLTRTNPRLAHKLKDIDTKNIHSWGDLYTKMGRAVNFNKKAMGDVRAHLLTRWRLFSTNPKITEKVAGKEFEKYKLKFTEEDIKVARDLSIHAGSIEALSEDTFLAIANNMSGVVRGATRRLAEATKRQIRAKILAKKLTGESIATVSREVKSILGNKGFSVLLDRSGRKWTLANYTKMVVRTQVIKSANEATLNRAGQFGIDIVQFSTHEDSCPICLPFQGRIYSVSGDSKNYPKLNVTLPLHPNGRHVWLLRPDLE